MPSFLYIIQNNLDGKTYVGVSKNDLHRLVEHQTGVKSNKHLQNAIKLYGVENFSFECIEEWPTYDKALEAEIEMIAYLKSIGAILYNMTNGGETWSREASIAGGNAMGAKNLQEAWKVHRESMLQNVRQNGKIVGKLAAQTWLPAYARSKRGRQRSAEALRKYLGSEKHRLAVSESNKRRCLTGRCGHQCHRHLRTQSGR